MNICPDCGGKQSIILSEDVSTGLWMIWCLGCDKEYYVHPDHRGTPTPPNISAQFKDINAKVKR